jgi:hypothetical protein
MKKPNSTRWIVWALLGATACAALGYGVGAARNRRRDGTTRPAPASRAETERLTSAARALRSAIADLSESRPDDAMTELAALDAYDPTNGYSQVMWFAARVAKDEMPAADEALAKALAAPRWANYAETVGLSGRQEIDSELEVLRNAEAGYRLAVLAGKAASGSAGLVSLRQLGLRVAAIEPPDMVHLRAGATFREQASQELLDLAKQQKDAAMVSRFEAQASADRAWREKVDAELMEFIRTRPSPEDTRSSDLWRHRITAEEDLVRTLVAEAPQ